MEDKMKLIILAILTFCFIDLFPQAQGDTILVSHSAGNADGNVYVTVDDPAQLTGDDYKVSFHTQQQIRDENGDWVTVAKNGTWMEEA